MIIFMLVPVFYILPPFDKIYARILMKSMSISMVKVSNEDCTDIDVDSLVRSTKVTFTIILGIRER